MVLFFALEIGLKKRVSAVKRWQFYFNFGCISLAPQTLQINSVWDFDFDFAVDHFIILRVERLRAGVLFRCCERELERLVDFFLCLERLRVAALFFARGLERLAAVFLALALGFIGTRCDSIVSAEGIIVWLFSNSKKSSLRSMTIL